MARVVRLLLTASWAVGMISPSALTASDTSLPEVAFPTQRPRDANFNRAHRSIIDNASITRLLTYCWQGDESRIECGEQSKLAMR